MSVQQWILAQVTIPRVMGWSPASGSRLSTEMVSLCPSPLLTLSREKTKKDGLRRHVTRKPSQRMVNAGPWGLLCYASSAHVLVQVRVAGP